MDEQIRKPELKPDWRRTLLNIEYGSSCIFNVDPAEAPTIRTVASNINASRQSFAPHLKVQIYPDKPNIVAIFNL
jgi:hypothetical protein